jgi:LPS export ABC transporter protein LptC
MEFFKLGKIATRLSANSGLVHTDSSDVRLSSSVVVTSLEDNSVLRTDELLYSSKMKKFITDHDVLVRRPGAVLRGRGLEANPDLTEIRIFHQTSKIEEGAQ